MSRIFKGGDRIAGIGRSGMRPAVQQWNMPIGADGFVEYRPTVALTGSEQDGYQQENRNIGHVSPFDAALGPDDIMQKSAAPSARLGVHFRPRDSLVRLWKAK